MVFHILAIENQRALPARTLLYFYEGLCFLDRFRDVDFNDDSVPGKGLDKDLLFCGFARAGGGTEDLWGDRTYGLVCAPNPIVNPVCCV